VEGISKSPIYNQYQPSGTIKASEARILFLDAHRDFNATNFFEYALEDAQEQSKKENDVVKLMAKSNVSYSYDDEVSETSRSMRLVAQ